MSFEVCATCGHRFSKEDGDIPYADGGIMEVIHGGGQCKKCYLESGHKECACGRLAFVSDVFCSSCGNKFPETV